MSNLATNDTAAMAMRLLSGSHELNNISVLRANSGGYLSDLIDLGDSWTRDGLYLGGAITFTLDEAAINDTGTGVEWASHARLRE